MTLAMCVKGCGRSAQLKPSTRKGLRYYPEYFGQRWCWACWYQEVYKRKMHLPISVKGPGAGPNDQALIHRLKNFNALHRPRLTAGAVYHEVPADDLMRILVRNDGLCEVTGRSGPLTFDHITPLVKGGDHVFTNLRAVLKEVNSEKGIG